MVEQGVEKTLKGGHCGDTVLGIASFKGHLPVVSYLVEQGFDLEMADNTGFTPLNAACIAGHLDVVRHLLEQGADRDKANISGFTPLHHAAQSGRLETAKLLMIYGADLNARTKRGVLPIDMTGATEEIKQAIRDEPRRRMDEAPGKRATEQDRHPDTATSASAQQEENEEEDEQQSNERPRLDDEGEETVEGKVARKTRIVNRVTGRTIEKQRWTVNCWLTELSSVNVLYTVRL